MGNCNEYCKYLGLDKDPPAWPVGMTPNKKVHPTPKKHTQVSVGAVSCSTNKQAKDLEDSSGRAAQGSDTGAHLANYGVEEDKGCKSGSGSGSDSDKDSTD
jgi:hypothetical protein